MLTIHQRMQIEANAARVAFDAAIEDLTERGGDVRCFSVAMLAAAVRLHVEIEGTDDLHRLLSRFARAELARTSGAGAHEQ